MMIKRNRKGFYVVDNSIVWELRIVCILLFIVDFLFGLKIIGII